MNRRFDAIVIGAGQAGPPMAGRIAATGKTVAVIERELIGGTCVKQAARQPRPSSPPPMQLTLRGAPATSA